MTACIKKKKSSRIIKHQFHSLMEQQEPDLDNQVEIREEVRKDEEEEVDTAH